MLLPRPIIAAMALLACASAAAAQPSWPRRLAASTEAAASDRPARPPPAAGVAARLRPIRPSPPPPGHYYPLEPPPNAWLQDRATGGM